MWKIFIFYKNKNKLVLTGGQKDISLSLAQHYYKMYVVNKFCSASYQQYSKKHDKPLDLYDKILELKNE